MDRWMDKFMDGSQVLDDDGCPDWRKDDKRWSPWELGPRYSVLRCLLYASFSDPNRDQLMKALGERFLH